MSAIQEISENMDKMHDIAMDALDYKLIWFKLKKAFIESRLAGNTHLEIDEIICGMSMLETNK